MLRFLLALIALLAGLAQPATAFAQSADPALLQKAIEILETQRNAALNANVNAAAQAAVLLDENAALKAQLDDIRKKLGDQPKVN